MFTWCSPNYKYIKPNVPILLMSKFKRGTLSWNLVEECRKLKESILEKGIVSNEKLLTMPKLQDMILEKKNRKVEILPVSAIKEILLG